MYGKSKLFSGIISIIGIFIWFGAKLHGLIAALLVLSIYNIYQLLINANLRIWVKGTSVLVNEQIKQKERLDRHRE